MTEKIVGMTRVALVMIVRNQARCIARCLQSAAPYVDEIIVLDTGSNDDTALIAGKMGARVHHFHWTDQYLILRSPCKSFYQ